MRFAQAVVVYQLVLPISVVLPTARPAMFVYKDNACSGVSPASVETEGVPVLVVTSVLEDIVRLLQLGLRVHPTRSVFPVKTAAMVHASPLREVKMAVAMAVAQDVALVTKTVALVICVSRAYVHLDRQNVARMASVATDRSVAQANA